MASASGASAGASKDSSAPGPFSSSARFRTRARQASILASSSPEIRYAGLRPAIPPECRPAAGRPARRLTLHSRPQPRHLGPDPAPGRLGSGGSAPPLGLLPPRALDLEVAGQRLVLGAPRPHRLPPTLEPVEQLICRQRLAIADVLSA